MFQTKPSPSWLLLILPFLVLGVMMKCYAFNNIAWDDWCFIIDRFPSNGMQPTWEGLLGSYSGHSLPILKLSIIPGMLWAQGDPRFILSLTVILALVTALLLARLVVRTMPDSHASSRGSRAEDFCILALAVASPIYSQVWQWWICWVIFLPFFCVLVSVTLLWKRDFTWLRFGAAMAISIIASQSHGSGAMVWLALAPCLFGATGKEGRGKRFLIFAIYLGIGLYIVRPFFMDAMAGGHGTSPESAGNKISKLLNYVLVLLGGSIGQGVSGNMLPLVKIFGFLVLLGSALLGGAALKRSVRHSDTFQNLIPWMSVCLFGLLSAATIGLARSQFPEHQALVGRYLLLTYPAWLALYFAFRVAVQSSSGGSLFAAHRVRLSAVVASVVILLQFSMWLEGRRSMMLDQAEHLASSAAIDFVRPFPNNPGLKLCYPDVPALLKTVDKLGAADLLFGFRLFKTDQLKELTQGHPLLPLKGGHLTGASSDAKGHLILQGYAYLYEEDRPADAILLTWESAEAPEPRIIALVSTPIRNDFYRSGERFRRPEKFSEWRVKLEPAEMPKGAGTLRSWAYSHARKRCYHLKNAAIIQEGKLADFTEEVRSPGTAELEDGWKSL